jgi:nucleotide-binding universal stress UspA family protein
MYSKVLVPLDGSKTAENALPLARSFARSLEIPVELLGVVDIAEMARHVSADRVAMLRTLADDATRRFGDYLERVAKNFSNGKGLCTVRQGNAPEAIIESAAAEKQTLIAMATHGRSGLDRWLLGSVAEKVLRGTSNPLLLVRASEQAPTDGQATFGSIVVPLDGSKQGELALAPALALARSMKIEMVLVRTYELPATVYYRADDYPASAAAFIPSYAELVEEMSREAREYIDAKVKELRSQGLEQVRSQVLEGNAAEEIIKLSQNTKGSLIAMCTHGQSGLKRWVLGGVTERVVHYSSSPVLVVPLEKDH